MSVTPADERRSTEHGEASGVSAGEQDVVGVDYDTLSGRALVVGVSDGAESGSAVHEYEHAVSA